MRVVSGAELRSELGLGALDRFIDLCDEATLEATSHIETDLRTPLLQEDRSDLFVLSPVEVRDTWLTLKAKAGFMDGNTVQVGTGISQASAADDSSLSNVALVNTITGVVTVTDAAIFRFVNVRYTAGFTVDSEGLFNLPPHISTWMKKAALAKSACILAMSNEFSSKDGKSIDGKAYGARYDKLIRSNIRYEPGAKLPAL